MRKFLSNFLLSIFVIVFAFPVSTFAQYSWTPPAGPPTGNNTPSPVNVGGLEQWKTGLLKVGQTEPLSPSGTIFSTSGSVVFDIPAGFSSSGSQNFTSFLPNASFFGNSLFQVGYPDGVGGSPRINLNGQLRYIPRNPNGSLTANQQPSAGKVLRALDDSGLIGWGDATGLPQGGNNGDILIWDSTTNQWIAGPNSGGSMPPGNPGETMWYDGSIAPNGEWVTTDQIYHDDQAIFASDDPNDFFMASKTTLTNDLVDIWAPQGTRVGNLNSGFIWLQSPEVKLPIGDINPQGKVITSIDSDGTLAWVDPSTIIGDGAGGCGATATLGQTCWFDGTAWVATDQIKHDSYSATGFPPFTPRTSISNPLIEIGTQSSGITRHYSPSVFFGTDVGGQNIRFNSSTIQFKGPANNSPLDPGIGRIPFSTDANGTFKWNKNLTYTESLLGSIGIAQLRLRNPNPSDIPGASSAISTFVNEGLTLLEDDTDVFGNLRVRNSGDLYLDGPDAPSILAGNAGLIPLCWNQNNNKVMRCTSTSSGNPIGSGDTPFQLPTEVTETFTTNGGQLEFPVSGPATIKYCGGGGGGGGGGIGTENNGLAAKGGGGGGGGARGECRTENLDVTAGQVLTWEIGEGGQGGRGTQYINFNSGQSSFVAASAGGQGYLTKIKIDNVQVGPNADGGAGGGVGLDAYLAAQGGSLTGGTGGIGGRGVIASNQPNGQLPQNSENWWHHGTEGGTSANTCAFCGGKGGTGEHPGNTELTSGLSARGGGGVFGQNNFGTNLVRLGQNGVFGDAANGGGGGGGGYGQRTNYYVASNPLPLSIGTYYQAGNGGNGGNGYVEVTYLDYITQPAAPTQYVFDSSQTIPASLFASIPGNNITVEVWGAGGGGGGAQATTSTPASQNAGGGGGAGAYVTGNIVKPTSSVAITVGQGGSAGVSGLNPTNGTNGQSSSFGSILTAGGGNGGVASNTSQTSGAGGTGSSVTSGGSPQAGGSGQSGSAGGQGGQGFESQNNGGEGARTSLGTISASNQATEGSSGLIRITW